LAVIAALIIVVFLVFLKRNEKRLEEEAVRALPGPLEGHQLRQAGRGHRRPGSADHQMSEQTHPGNNAAGRPDVRPLDATRAKNKR